MNRVVCNYAIVRYSPFLETGEFANIGIVLFAPKVNYFAFMLMEKRYARITRFFEDVDACMYKSVTSNLKEEFERLKKLFELENYAHGKGYPALKNSLFDELLRTRESIARFSERRTILTDNPSEKIKELYKFYVERNFATREYRETVLEKDVRRLLFQNRLIERFSALKVGNVDYEVPFPFVETSKNKVLRVIKPLNLTQEDSSKILEHGGKWEFRIKELKKRDTLPEKVLFAVEGPSEMGSRQKAYLDVMMLLKELGVRTVQHDDKSKILQFATN